MSPCKPLASDLHGLLGSRAQTIPCSSLLILTLTARQPCLGTYATTLLHQVDSQQNTLQPWLQSSAPSLHVLRLALLHLTLDAVRQPCETPLRPCRNLEHEVHPHLLQGVQVGQQAYMQAHKQSAIPPVDKIETAIGPQLPILAAHTGAGCRVGKVVRT